MATQTEIHANRKWQRDASKRVKSATPAVANSKQKLVPDAKKEEGDSNASDAPSDFNANKSRIRFEPEQDDLLWRLKDEGKTWKDIAVMMRIPRAALYERFSELSRMDDERPAGGDRFIFQPEQDAMLRRLKAEEKSWKEISEKMGMSKHVLHDRYWELADSEMPRYSANRGEQGYYGGNQLSSNNNWNCTANQTDTSKKFVTFESSIDKQLRVMKAQNKSWKEICVATGQSKIVLVSRWKNLQEMDKSSNNGTTTRTAPSSDKEPNREGESPTEKKSVWVTVTRPDSGLGGGNKK